MWVLRFKVASIFIKRIMEKEGKMPLRFLGFK